MKRPSAIFDPFEIVVVPFPFTEKAATKRRPALVLSTRAFNIAQGQLILAMITSTAEAWASDVPIVDWSAVGLTAACRVRMKLFTLAGSLVFRPLGALSTRDRQAVRASIKDVLATI